MIFNGGLSTRQPRKESVTIQINAVERSPFWNCFEGLRLLCFHTFLPSCCFSFAFFSLSVTVWVISNFVTVLLELSFPRQDWKVAGKVDKSDKGTFDLTPDSVETYIFITSGIMLYHFHTFWHHRSAANLTVLTTNIFLPSLVTASTRWAPSP